MNTTAKIITGFLLGAVVGTVTGLLVAPSPGKKTLRNLEKRTKKLAKQLAGYIGVSGSTQRTAPASQVKNGRSSVAAQ